MKILVSLVMFLMCVRPAFAAGPLDAPFDPSIYDASEKRFLQAALALEGSYNSRLDGAWGRGSQSALETAVRNRGGTNPTLRDVATLTRDTIKELKEDKWAVAAGAASRVSFLLPRARMNDPVQTASSVDYRPRSGTLRVRSWITVGGQARALHAQLAGRANDRAPLYKVDRNGVQITTGVLGDGTSAYLRSEKAPGTGTIVATLFEWTDTADRKDSRAAQLAIASLKLGGQDVPRIPRGPLRAHLKALNAASPAVPVAGDDVPKPGLVDADDGKIDLEQALKDLVLERLRRRDDPAFVAEDLEEKRTPSRAGLGFYINNTDILTSAAVIAHCGDAGLKMVDGTKVRPLQGGAALGLAILTSPRRSDHWLAIAGGDRVRARGSVSVLGLSKKGWAASEAAMVEGNVLGYLNRGGKHPRAVIEVAARKRTIGAPLLDAKSRVTGVTLGPLDVPGMNAEQRKRARKMSVAVSGEDVPDMLTLNGIAHQRAIRGRDIRANDPVRALVPLMCR